ncbi:MAG: hypothetical protein GF388_09210 [Candidatus Aegiribacteria sp.]|nr:hypothetical protein [Candidatus Aegiribacteria sp.]MBD3295235.1 hypothetical protein [Candidatus Fermentibacteria bacterium]
MVKDRSRFVLAAAVSFFLLCFPPSLESAEILFTDDFSSGSLEENWIFYGDPQPKVIDSLGFPPPCFNNNGDANGGSGIISREVFPMEVGFFTECDVYFSCRERGTWVTPIMAIITPDFRNDDATFRDFMVAQMSLAYSGELDWHCPHRQTIVYLHCMHDLETKFIQQYYHQDQLSGGWHRLRMEIDAEKNVRYLMDDSLWAVSTVSIPDTLSSVRIKLGDRSSDWGIALHDNLRVGIAE